ncbi:MAG: hypothetical protein WCO84_02215 [bacterium]
MFSPNYLLAQVDFIKNVTDQIINPIIVFLLAISFFYFIYGIYEFVATGESKKIEEGKKHVLWGLIGLFIIVSISGIIGLVQGTVDSLLLLK